MLPMNHLMPSRAPIACLLALLVVTTAAASPKPPEMPATIDVAVAPTAVSAGESAHVTVQLEPIDGVQINRYPRITLKLAGRDGLAADAEVMVGNSAPPEPGKMDANYFDRVDPLNLEIVTDAGAPAGTHTLNGELTYFYCVKASGFCAPKKTSVAIPLQIH